jgi:hypothetical protein
MPVPLSSIGRELGKERSSCRERRGLSGRSSRVAIVGKIMRKRERAGRKPRTVWHVISPVRGHPVRQKESKRFEKKLEPPKQQENTLKQREKPLENCKDCTKNTSW